VKYEYTVKTILVPWKDGEPWPYLPAQDAILAAMNEMGLDRWQVIERVWATSRPENDSIPWPVNLWAYRTIEGE
jgi:hypothetical protein